MHLIAGRYIVESTKDYALFLRVATVSHKRNRLALQRTPCDLGHDDNSSKCLRRTQFLIRVNFALAPNRAQDQQFSAGLGLDLHSDCFTYGALYLALSHELTRRSRRFLHN